MPLKWVKIIKVVKTLDSSGSRKLKVCEYWRSVKMNGKDRRRVTDFGVSGETEEQIQEEGSGLNV